jgi:hypothetical protein
MCAAKIVIEAFHSTARVFDVLPFQPRRILNLPDGSAAKVFEARSLSVSTKASRVLRRPPGKFRTREPEGRGCRGRLFFGYVSFGEAKESNSPSGEKHGQPQATKPIIVLPQATTTQFEYPDLT